MIRTEKPWETAAGPLLHCFAQALVVSLWKPVKDAETFSELRRLVERTLTVVED
jgi:hypothetical protein